MYGFRVSMIVAAACLSCLSAAATADEFPARPIRLVVGGGSDVPARVVAQFMSAELKQPVAVLPLPAAGGVIAAKTVKDSPADGYTLLNSTGAYLLNQVARQPPPFVMGRDFTPVALLGTAPQIVVVPPSLPVATLPEFIAYAKANPNKLNCASAGIGGSSHLACEMLRHYGKVELPHVAYKGVAPALTDVMAKRAEITYTAVSALGAIKEGRLKAIAVTGSRRLAALPDVPTVAEQGLPQLTLITWYGVHAPAGTPAGVVDAVNRSIARALKDRAVLAALEGSGLEPETMTVAAFSEFMSTQEATVAKLWRESGAKIE